MALHHFFVDEQVLGDIDDPSFVLRLSADDLKHARVLRLEVGEHIAVIDAAQDYFECEVVSFTQRALEVCIAQQYSIDDDGPIVGLIQGIAKGSKMDQIIRQTTELGIRGFIPFASERSQVKLDQTKSQIRVARWRQIAKSAAMQSGRAQIPDIAQPMSLEEVCSFIASASAVVICWEEARSGSIREVLEKALAALYIEAVDARVVVVVGPEGGLSEEEVSSLLAANPRAGVASLGSYVLRTETAGVVASALVLHELGALQ